VRFLTGGESHGSFLTAILEGLPCGIPLAEKDIQEDLLRRNNGLGRGARMALETEEIRITGGVRNGFTTGAPVVLMIPNSENAVLSQKEISALQKDAYFPRPGHADLAGLLKFGFSETRNVIERASGRETAARVAVGAVAKKFLKEFDIAFASAVLQVGTIRSSVNPAFKEALKLDKRFPFPDPKKKNAAVKLIEKCKTTGETLGGKVWVSARGAVPGLGSYTQWDKRLDSRLSRDLMSIPSVKGLLIGDIESSVDLDGSAVQDEIRLAAVPFYKRKTNRAGGIEGGVSNGEDIELTLLVKPLPSSRLAKGSVDLRTLKSAGPEIPRSDTTAVVPVAIVAEALMAITLAEACLEKFGNDSLKDILKAFIHYKKRIDLK
jgi:chorismate synthase